MKIRYLFYFIYLFFMFSCDNTDLSKDPPEIIVCPVDNSKVFVLTVDYTTNRFKGGYQISLPQYVDSLHMVSEYNSPGDFGDITWYDKATDTKLFAGTIIWSGKGVRTFPEKLDDPSSYVKIHTPTAMPKFIPLKHYESDVDSSDSEQTNYLPIWESVKYLQSVSWLTPSSLSYIYLYQPSVGIGDPADWYWVIFFKY